MTTLLSPSVPAALAVSLEREEAAGRWDTFLTARPEGHLLQTWEWGTFKSGQGWRPARLAVHTPGAPAMLAGASVLFRQPLARVPIRMAYVPRGPAAELATVTAPSAALLAGLHAYCRRHGAVFLKIEPNLPATAPLRRALEAAGFREGPHVQPRRSIVLDLQPGRPEDALLAAMKPKTRYNIRLAQRRGVQIRRATSLSGVQQFYALLQATAIRDAFGIHDFAYYRRVWELFQESSGGVVARPAAVLLLADHPDCGPEPIGGLLAFACGAEAIYMYGASGDRGREHMPSYLLQWEAMRWARQRGCRVYDFWGIPDLPESEAPAPGENPNVRQGLWGVYRFKQGFGGAEVEYAGAWDFVYRPVAYALYRRWLARRE